MNKFIILAAVVAVVAGEAPAHVGLTSFSNGGGSSGSGINEYVDEALLARVGELISSGGDGSGTPQGTEGLRLDADILTRVSGSLGDEGGNSGPSSSYGPPQRSAPGMLGNPEAAERIAEFELTDTRQAEQGGYEQAPPAAAPAPAPAYGAPSRSAPSRSGPVTLGRPEAAQRVLDFSVDGGSSAPARNNGGYNNGYN